jgi:hypothetical protein
MCPAFLVLTRAYSRNLRMEWTVSYCAVLCSANSGSRACVAQIECEIRAGALSVAWPAGLSGLSSTVLGLTFEFLRDFAVG